MPQQERAVVAMNTRTGSSNSLYDPETVSEGVRGTPQGNNVVTEDEFDSDEEEVEEEVEEVEKEVEEEVEEEGLHSLGALELAERWQAIADRNFAHACKNGASQQRKSVAKFDSMVDAINDMEQLPKRQRRRVSDAVCFGNRLKGKKPFRITLLEGGEVDPRSQGKPDWDSVMRTHAPRTLDVSRVMWKDQKKESIDRLWSIMNAEFIFDNYQLSSGGFKRAALRFLKNFRSSLKKKFKDDQLDCPPTVEPPQWERLLTYWRSKKAHLKAEKMTNARKSVKNVSNVGRKGLTSESRPKRKHSSKDTTDGPKNPCASEHINSGMSEQVSTWQVTVDKRQDGFEVALAKILQATAANATSIAELKALMTSPIGSMAPIVSDMVGASLPKASVDTVDIPTQVQGAEDPYAFLQKPSSNLVQGGIGNVTQMKGKEVVVEEAANAVPIVVGDGEIPTNRRKSLRMAAATISTAVELKGKEAKKKATTAALKKGAKPLAKVSVGEKVWLLNPNDPNMKVAKGTISAIAGGLSHFCNIEEGWCKVDIAEALVPDVELMRPNSMDDQVLIRDVVKTSTMWEVRHILTGA